MEEVWKDVVGYENLYRVNNFGEIMTLEKDIWTHNKTRVQHRPAKKLKAYKNMWGYMKVKLYKDGIKKEQFVHRIVAMAFIDNPENKPCINHIDNDRTNNNVSNLEWCTYQENSDWAKIQGRKVMTEECRQKILATRIRKPVIGTDPEGNEYYFDKVRAVEDMGFDTRGVIDCCKGKRAHFKGFVWRYAETEITA